MLPVQAPGQNLTNFGEKKILQNFVVMYFSQLHQCSEGGECDLVASQYLLDQCH